MDFTTLRMPRPSLHQLQELKGRHREIIRLAYLGTPRKDIAERFGITEASVTGVLQSELAREHMNMLEAHTDSDCIDARQRLENLQGVAVDYYERILKGDVLEASVSHRMKAAAEVLDRSGLPRMTKVEASSQNAYLVRVGIEELVGRGKELGIVNAQPALP